MKVTIYKAQDGTTFEDRKAFQDHEIELTIGNAIATIANSSASEISDAIRENGSVEIRDAIELLGKLATGARLANGGGKRQRKPKDGAA